MKKLVTTAIVAAIAGYGRHCYLTGYLKGRGDLTKEMERINRMIDRRTSRHG